MPTITSMSCTSLPCVLEIRIGHMNVPIAEPRLLSVYNHILPNHKRCYGGRSVSGYRSMGPVTEQKIQRKDTQMSERGELTPAALYARVSSDRQDVDLSVAAQLRALRGYADMNGYIVVREYVDEAESGYTADRPEFNRMIDEAKSPQAAFREILVWKFSRFTRKREHAVAFKAMLRRRGVRVPHAAHDAAARAGAGQGIQGRGAGAGAGPADGGRVR